PTGKYAYVANYGAGSISQYSIGTDGKLAPMSTPTVAAEANPNDVVVDASGKYAYATNFGSDTVSRYTIGASGALTAAPVMPSITTQDSPTNMYVSRGFTPVSY